MDLNNQILDHSLTKPLSGGPSFTLKNRLFRIVWNFIWLILASWTPPLMYPWRWVLLTLFGAKMAWPSDVRGSARVWYPPFLKMNKGALIAENVICYNQGRIILGINALISQGAHLCAGTHNIDDPNFQLVTKPIIIGNNAWVAAEAFVGPGVTLGDFSVLGARGVAFSDIGNSMVYTGNPAKYLRSRKLNTQYYGNDQ